MKRILVWGTGSCAEKLMAEFPKENMEILGFVDNDPNRQGRLFHDKPVLTPKAAAGSDFDLLLIASTFAREICTQAVSLGIDEKRILLGGANFLSLLGKIPFEKFLMLTSVPFWYHRFEIMPGVMTPGICAYKPELLSDPSLADLSGKDVLDIGAWDGPYTLEMSRRGAKVTALDIQPAENSGFDVMRKINKLNVRHFCANVYDLQPEVHGLYDVVTFFGVYYHLRNPLAAFININNVLRPGGILVTEGVILEGAPKVDDFWADKEEEIRRMAPYPMGCFVKDNYQGEWSNWWVPNMTCLRHWHESCGFEVLTQKLVENDSRAYVFARKTGTVPREHIVLGSR